MAAMDLGPDFDRIDNKRPTRIMAVAFLVFVFLMLVPAALLLWALGGSGGMGLWETATVLFLAVMLGWAALAGPRIWFMGRHSPVDWLAGLMFRRTLPVPVVDEGPAQLRARRGDVDGAIAMYDEWIRAHPALLTLRFHRAELLHHAKRDPVAARGAYREAVELVRRKGADATEEEQQSARLAEAVLRDLRLSAGASSAGET
jgi:tetratricopeptide (TPR) repeat protein